MDMCASVCVWGGGEKQSVWCLSVYRCKSVAKFIVYQRLPVTKTFITVTQAEGIGNHNIRLNFVMFELCIGMFRFSEKVFRTSAIVCACVWQTGKQRTITAW